jgi:UDP-4-amino-4,6-dideoxy-N-acetyl-beta-L-altrosamine transaminase
MEQKPLHYGCQYYDNDEINAVVEVLKSDFLSSGPRIRAFEQLMQEQTGAKYCVAVANGTAALHLAVKALDIEAGKSGITSPLTFIASSNAMIYNGLRPDFADIDERNYCLDPVEFKKRINQNTAVVVPVHFAGHPADMEKISDIARKRGICIVEDASHALGSKYINGEPVGSCCYSDLTTYSFHPVKTITTGEGGAITTNDHFLYEKLLMLRNHGITKDPDKFKIQMPGYKVGPWYYEMQELGFNYRLTDIQAALGIVQLKKLSGFVKRRRQIIDAYNRAFKDVKWLSFLKEHPKVFCALHLYVLLIDFEAIGKSRTQVMMELKSKGINTQVHYIPVHLQPYYRENYRFRPGDFPRAEAYYDRCLSIPLYPKMTDDDVQRVIEVIIGLK